MVPAAQPLASLPSELVNTKSIFEMAKYGRNGGGNRGGCLGSQHRDAPLLIVEQYRLGKPSLDCQLTDNNCGVGFELACAKVPREEGG